MRLRGWSVISNGIIKTKKHIRVAAGSFLILSYVMPHVLVNARNRCFAQRLLYPLTRKLHCTRNYIHMNLFVSFILRAVAVISKEVILYIMYSSLPKDDPGWKSYSSSAVWKTHSIMHILQIFEYRPTISCGVIIKLFAILSGTSQQIVLLCKFSKVCMEYCVACNYFWLLVEAVFLHTLLFTAVLTKRRLLKKYMLLGWGKGAMASYYIMFMDR